MNIIVAVDQNWAIGYRGRLLVKIPADHRFFRNETIHKAVIVGRKTLEDFPDRQPLKERLNVVMSSRPDYEVKGASVVHSVEEAMDAVREYPSQDVYVIGGASVYEQMLPICDVALVTKIDYRYDADTFFPNLDKMDDWVLTWESEEQTYHDLTYTFCRYERKRREANS